MIAFFYNPITVTIARELFKLLLASAAITMLKGLLITVYFWYVNRYDEKIDAQIKHKDVVDNWQAEWDARDLERATTAANANFPPRPVALAAATADC